MNDNTNPVSAELVDAISDAFNSNDIDKVMSFFADDAVFDHAAGPDVQDGPRGQAPSPACSGSH